MEEQETFELNLTKPVLWLIHSVMEEMSGEEVTLQDLDDMLGRVLSQEGIEVYSNETLN